MPAEIFIRTRSIKEHGYEATCPLLKVTAHAKTEAQAVTECRQAIAATLRQMLREVQEIELSNDGTYMDEFEDLESSDPVPVPSLNNAYAISIDGDVFNVSTGKQLKVTRYGTVTLNIGSGPYRYAVRRVDDLLAEVFPPK